MALTELATPDEVLERIGESARRLRLHRNLTQAELAARADVGVRTLQRFEDSGRVSTDVLVRLAFALGVERSLEAIFVRPAASTMDELLERDSRPPRRRARRSK